MACENCVDLVQALISAQHNCCQPCAMNIYFNRPLFKDMNDWFFTQKFNIENSHLKPNKRSHLYCSLLTKSIMVNEILFKRVLICSFDKSNCSLRNENWASFLETIRNSPHDRFLVNYYWQPSRRRNTGLVDRTSNLKG